MVRKVYIGLGTNLGARRGNISRAIGLLGEKIDIISCSSIYETEPVGRKDQNWFLNCVVAAQTGFSPDVLFELVKDIESRIGRKRGARWGPRIIDLDILAYGDMVLKRGELKIPHPEMHRRGFVLIPLGEIAPDFIHPVYKKNIPALLKKAGRETVAKLT